MTAPQPGIFALGSRSHHHLELDLAPGATADDVRRCLARLSQPRVAGGATNVVLGFGPDLWRRLAPGRVPDGLASYRERTSPNGRHLPATQHDLWVWVHGAGVDEVIDKVRAVHAELDPATTLVGDVSCFVYHDSRDLTGFVDGSANPTPPEAPEMALVADGEPGEGGSHVILQHWVHDLGAFGQLDVADQELVFGRTKLDSVQLDDAVKPPDAHISRAEVHDESGEERPIYRRSTPWATASAQGLQFLGFSAERDRFDAMLDAMYDVAGEGLEDRLLSFSTPETGSFYFAPSAEELRALTSG